jgi:hypothetical protein
MAAPRPSTVGKSARSKRGSPRRPSGRSHQPAIPSTFATSQAGIASSVAAVTTVRGVRATTRAPAATKARAPCDRRPVRASQAIGRVVPVGARRVERPQHVGHAGGHQRLRDPRAARHRRVGLEHDGLVAERPGVGDQLRQTRLQERLAAAKARNARPGLPVRRQLRSSGRGPRVVQPSAGQAAESTTRVAYAVDAHGRRVHGLDASTPPPP